MFEINKLNTVYGDDLEYFTQFMSIEKTRIGAKRFDVKEVKYCKYKNGVTVESTPADPVFEFGLGSKFKKIYRPKQEEHFKKHSWLVETPNGADAVFGLKLLPDDLKGLIVFNSFEDSFVFNSIVGETSKIQSIGLNGTSAIFNQEIIELLKIKTPNIILSFKNTQNAQIRSLKLAKRFGLKTFEYPEELKTKGGEGFADLLKLKLISKDYNDNLNQKIKEQCPIMEKKSPEQLIVQRLLDLEDDLNCYSENEIEFAPPLLKMGDVGIIYKGAINTIQGKMGSFKSRLASSIGIKILNDKYDFLNFSTFYSDPITLVYIDTERSLKDEYAIAIKNIKDNIGIGSFRFISLKKESRKERLNYLRSYLREIRKNTEGHIVVIIDVVTDTIKNSNDIEESYILIDDLGNLTEDYDATVLAIVHENPGGDKARGHIGTELGNKSSSLISIGYDKNKSGEDSEFIKIRYLKNRNNKRPEPTYCKFSKTDNRLVLVTEDELKSIQNVKKEKAEIEDVIDEIQIIFDEVEILEQQRLMEKLIFKFSASKGTITSRLTEIVNEKYDLIDKDGVACNLVRNSKSGTKTSYFLKPVLSSEEPIPKID
jgi:AAA domain